MNPQTIQLIQTVLIAIGLFVIGLIIKRLKEWLYKILFGQLTPSQKAEANNLQLMNQLLELKSKKKIVGDLFKNKAKLVVNRTVDNILGKYLDLVRNEVEKGNPLCPVDCVHHAVSIFELINASARFQQIELYMTSIETDDYSDKSPTEWHVFKSNFFDIITEKLTSYYKSKYQGKAVSVKALISRSEDHKNEIYSVYSEAMEQLRILSEQNKDEVKGIEDEIQKVIRTVLTNK